VGSRKSHKRRGERGKLVEWPGSQRPASKRRGESTSGTISGITPGIIAGAADLDPAAVLTATVAGASFGLSVGWVVILCIPILRTVFHVATRIGQQTEQGLVELIREHYGKRPAVLIALLMVGVNGTMIVADLMAVSDGFSLILNQPSVFFSAAIGFLVWYLLSSAGYSTAVKAMGWLALLLLAYVVGAVLVTSSWSGLLKGLFLPQITATQAYALAVIAVFGSLLTPDVIVWQTSSRRDAAQAGAPPPSAHSIAGTFVAGLISLSVIVTASALKVPDAANMTTRMAAQALGVFGAAGPWIFSVGIIGSGLVALPILAASLCFSIAEAVNWESGLNTPPWQARQFYLLICGLLVIAVGLSYAHINVVKALYWSQVFAGILVVPLLLFILLLANNPAVVARRNSRGENLWLLGAICGMTLATAAVLWTLLKAF
jgi:Mn2+/Fe2+ NRAMP family transporter